MEGLRIAIAKGKLLSEARDMLVKAGYSCEGLNDDDRQMIFELPECGFTVMAIRPVDVPTYVELGAADLGITGKDVIMEAGRELYELMDLKFGACHFSLAVPENNQNVIMTGMRIASKFPRVTRNYFSAKNMSVEVIKLNGAVEIAPLVGLSDAIVDIVSSGRTLKENNMVEAERMYEISARLIANRISYRTRFAEIAELEKRLKAVLEQ